MCLDQVGLQAGLCGNFLNEVGRPTRRNVGGPVLMAGSWTAKEWDKQTNTNSVVGMQACMHAFMLAFLLSLLLNVIQLGALNSCLDFPAVMNNHLELNTKQTLSLWRSLSLGYFIIAMEMTPGHDCTVFPESRCLSELWKSFVSPWPCANADWTVDLWSLVGLFILYNSHCLLAIVLELRNPLYFCKYGRKTQKLSWDTEQYYAHSGKGGAKKARLQIRVAESRGKALSVYWGVRNLCIPYIKFLHQPCILEIISPPLPFVYSLESIFPKGTNFYLSTCSYM